MKTGEVRWLQNVTMVVVSVPNTILRWAAEYTACGAVLLDGAGSCAFVPHQKARQSIQCGLYIGNIKIDPEHLTGSYCAAQHASRARGVNAADAAATHAVTAGSVRRPQANLRIMSQIAEAQRIGDFSVSLGWVQRTPDRRRIVPVPLFELLAPAHGREI